MLRQVSAHVTNGCAVFLEECHQCISFSARWSQTSRQAMLNIAYPAVHKAGLHDDMEACIASYTSCQSSACFATYVVYAYMNGM